jgi:predicted nucleotidyltransferase
MMLTMLVLLHEAGVALPQRRWDLYQRISEAFLFSWEEKKRSVSRGLSQHSLQVDDRELVWILESIALEMQRKDWTLVPRWWLLEHIGTFLRDELGYQGDESRAEADTLLGSLQKRSGLVVGRGPERFGFSHLAFQEYFAARAVLALGDPFRELQPYFYHPRWLETVRLVASQLDRRRAPQLLRMVLDDPDPTGRFLRRGLLTALACLADGAPVHDRQLLGDLNEQAAGLGRSKWIGIALDVLHRLSRLRGTRLGDFATSVAEALLAEARKSLEPQDVFGLGLRAASVGLLDLPVGEQADGGNGEGGEESPGPPISSQKLRSGGEEFEVLMARVPDHYDQAWVREALTQLREDPSPGIRAAVASYLGSFGDRKKVRGQLVRELGEQPEPSVRAAVALALEGAARHRSVSSALLSVLGTDAAAEARAGCATALRRAAPRRRDVRERLISILGSSQSPLVRAGAARGLSRCVAGDSEVLGLLLSNLRSKESPDEVRVSCLYALEDALPSMPDEVGFLGELLSGPADTKLARVAAQVLAEFAAAGRFEWGKLPIARIEEVLTSLRSPCQHALDALRALLNARELRRLGIPREARIRRAFSDLEDRIRILFIFGSSARGEQRPESDVDLMVIGDASLRELTPGLKRVEQELGRQVNAVALSEDEWRTRCVDRDVFTRNVLSQRKVFIMGDNNELTAMAGQLVDR